MTSRIVVLDNTVLSNFAIVDRPDLVLDLWGANCATTSAVLAEYQVGIISRGLPADSWDDLPLLELEPVEKTFAAELTPKLGAGERSCIALAFHRSGLFVCDDAFARREAQRLGVNLTGTIGILVLNVRLGKLTPAKGNTILANMIVQGYRSPTTVLDDLL